MWSTAEALRRIERRLETMLGADESDEDYPYPWIAGIFSRTHLNDTLDKFTVVLVLRTFFGETAIDPEAHGFLLNEALAKEHRFTLSGKQDYFITFSTGSISYILDGLRTEINSHTLGSFLIQLCTDLFSDSLPGKTRLLEYLETNSNSRPEVVARQ